MLNKIKEISIDIVNSLIDDVRKDFIFILKEDHHFKEILNKLDIFDLEILLISIQKKLLDKLTKEIKNNA